MKDEKIHVKGWPSSVRSRGSNKIGAWHRDWSRRHEHRGEFRPDGRIDGSEYNLHHLDVDTPLGSEADYGRRVDEISGRDPDTRQWLPEPDAHGRFRGAMLAATAGDALGAAVASGAVRRLSWEPSVMLPDDELLTEYVAQGPLLRPTALTQLSAFSVEGLIRAHAARRNNPVDNDPVPEVQHAFQRWLFTQRVPRGTRGQWRGIGGPYAAHHDEPDGWLVQQAEMYVERAPNPGVLAALGNFAGRGVGAAHASNLDKARGGDVVARAAMLAVWSNELHEVFAAAADVAALTHESPDDYLPAGVLAGILHQQLRGLPFSDCLFNAYQELTRWRGSEKTATLIDKSVKVTQTVWTPAPVSEAHRHFGDGADGAEALAIALYAALASDYVREALQLAMNYTENRSVVGAICGVMVGAEYGDRAIPSDLGAFELRNVIETLSNDALAEFSPGPPVGQEWLRRYPAW